MYLMTSESSRWNFSSEFSRKNTSHELSLMFPDRPNDIKGKILCLLNQFWQQHTKFSFSVKNVLHPQ